MAARLIDHVNRAKGACPVDVFGEGDAEDLFDSLVRPFRLAVDLGVIYPLVVLRLTSRRPQSWHQISDIRRGVRSEMRVRGRPWRRTTLCSDQGGVGGTGLGQMSRNAKVVRATYLIRFVLHMSQIITKIRQHFKGGFGIGMPTDQIHRNPYSAFIHIHKNRSVF